VVEKKMKGVDGAADLDRLLETGEVAMGTA
jgi:hypothetical protein